MTAGGDHVLDDRQASTGYLAALRQAARPVVLRRLADEQGGHHGRQRYPAKLQARYRLDIARIKRVSTYVETA